MAVNFSSIILIMQSLIGLGHRTNKKALYLFMFGKNIWKIQRGMGRV